MELGLAELEHANLVWTGPQWVGAHAPTWDRAGIGSSSSNADDAASLSFETTPLGQPIEILGRPEVEVTVTSDRRVGMVAARLLMVSPEGEAHLICRGNRNLAFPVDLSAPSRVEAGAPTTIRFPLLAASAIIPRGWRLRLALAGADFPVVWPPGERFTLTVDPRGSKLLLPVVPTRPESRNLDWGESEPPPSPPTFTPLEERTWSVSRDDGVTTYRREVASTEEQPERAELTYDSKQQWEVGVADDDPATTRVWSQNEIHLERPGWKVGTIGTLEMSGDDMSFHLIVELKALHNGAQIWERRWDEEVPREWA
jgi:hypothetical protein